jgi:hypothetical protein
MSRVFCEISEDGRRIEVWFKYDKDFVNKMKTEVSGARFVGRDKSYNGQPHWVIPLDIECCRQLRRAFGDDLGLGDAVKDWGNAVTRYERGLRSIASSDTARLHRLPEVLPKLYRAIHTGPLGRWMSDEERDEAMKREASFQAADVAFMAYSDNPLNGNHPGLGKTPETIAAVFEAKLDDGPMLVIAPKSALEATWLTELEEWQPHPVYVSTGSKARKQAIIEAFEDEVVAPGFSGWLVVNPDQVRYRENFEPCDYHCGRGMSPKMKKEMRKCPSCVVSNVSEFPTIHGTPWNVIVIDECHKGAVRNPNTLTAKGMFGLKVKEGGKRIALTGTPMGGKIINLWGILHYLNPTVFTSKWRWADQWTDVASNDYGKTIGESIKHCPAHFGHNDEEEGRPDCVRCREIEDAFYNMLAPYMTRRTKAEALPWLPAKQFVPLWVDFSSEKARKQYEEFNNDSMTMIESMPVTAMSVLDEYTRLKQFSFGYHVHRESDGKLVPTEDSGKLDALQEKLEELGIWDGSTDEQAVIFSQFSEVVDLIHGWLNKQGVPTTKITGAISGSKQRGKIKEDFQSGEGARVIVMTTTAGGVSITLDRASNVFIMDETWDPDDQEQAEDRCHRASRLHQVTVYYIRTKGTIEEMIAERTGTKFARNVRVLDARRLSEKANA